jgi:hypothetical protein
MTDKIFVYGFAADHRVVSYRFIAREYFCIRELYYAADVVADHPEVVRVYALDNFPELFYEYRKAIKNPMDFAEHLAFESLVKDRGILVKER